MAKKERPSATMRMFGSQLKMWRTRAGVSREQLGEESGYSPEMVSAVERGLRKPPVTVIRAAEDLCGAGPFLQDAADKIVVSRFPDWFEEYVEYEADAASLGLYENHVVPGLFQTEEYGRAVFLNEYPRLDDDEIERRLAARLERQALLSRTPTPMISAVIEEAMLHRWIGGREVMREQIARLVEIAEMRHVEVQVMPTRRETHVGLAGPMYVVETTDQRRLAYSEVQKGSVLISDPEVVSVLNQRYAMLRSQALTPEDSLSLLRTTLGEL
ncbi:helix-turn-helix domain-containing protein [Streptomyces sp. NPDC054796]